MRYMTKFVFVAVAVVAVVVAVVNTVCTRSCPAVNSTLGRVVCGP